MTPGRLSRDPMNGCCVATIQCTSWLWCRKVVVMTEQVGVRELRDQLSSYLDRVRHGEQIEVTDRGRPVAMLIPLPDDRRELAELIASGTVTPAKRPWRPGRPRVTVPSGEPSLSEVLDELRADER